MMRKRQFIAGFLILTMLLSLTGMLTTPASATAPTVKVEPEIKYATDSGAFLKNIELSQTGAWNLTVKASPAGSGQTYAVLLRYDLFNANYNTDGSIGGINPGTYTNLAPGTANSNYYRYENATAVNGTALTIFNKNLYNFNSGNTGYQVTETSTTYHMKYALVIFDGGTDVKDLSDYTIVTFYINSQGYLQTESYMLRYQRNMYPTGTNSVGSMPAYQIEGWGTDAAVNGTTRPTRVGYTFLGWDANSKLMNADANTAAAQAVTPQYPAGNTGPVPWGTISTAFGGAAFNKDSDKFYDLYAVWRPNAVKFDITNAPTTGSVGGVNIHVLTLPEPQVGVAYGATIALASSPTDAGTTKGYTWQSVGQTVTVGDKTGTIVNLSNDYKLSVAASGNMNWRISGTPTEHSNGKDVYAVLQVKDNGNNTTDLIILHFPQVKKGAQPVPTLDDNTGLQSRIVTTEDSTDGQIYGFYSAGPKKETDTDKTGYLSSTNGTGTMTQYYLDNRMVYEYRPVLVDGKEVDYTDLPNGGWREMPMPSNWYTVGSNKLTQAEYDSFVESLKKGSSTVIETGYDTSQGRYAPVKVIASGDLPEGFKGWPDSYGWIEYDGTLPILHGLTQDDKYEVRFRKNSSYEVSESKVLTIGGAVSGGETPVGSGGLAVNLSGGTEQEDPSGFSSLKDAAKALTSGQQLDLNIYKFEPTRDGCTFLGWTLGERDADGNLILYRTDEPKMITVTWKNYDDTVLKTESIPTGSALPEHPEAPTREDGYTFKEWVRSEDADGNITFTATYEEATEPTPPPEVTPTPEPEIPEPPAARDGEGEGTDPEPPGGGDGEETPDPTPSPDPEPSPEPPPAEKHVWKDGLTGETLSESEEPQKPYHECYTAGEWVESTEEDGTKVHTVAYTRNTKVPMPADTPASLAAVWSGGTRSTDGIIAVSVSDWDGVALGTFIFFSDPDPAIQKANADAAKNEFLAREDVAAKLTSHAGYDFLDFVKDEDGVPTSYGKRVASNSNTVVAELEIAPENIVDFSTLESSTTVSVAYTTNASIELGEGLDATSAMNARRYKTSIDSYGRFGTSQSFAIRIKVERGNVPRSTQAALRVRLEINGVSVYSQYDLSGADEEVIEVAPFAQSNTNGTFTGVSVVEWTVVDKYELSNWVGAAARTTLNECQSKASFTVKNVGTTRSAVWDEETYPLYGVVASFNEALRTYHEALQLDPTTNVSTMTAISVANLRSIGIPPVSTNATTLRRTIYNGWLANGAKDLSYEELYQIASGS